MVMNDGACRKLCPIRAYTKQECQPLHSNIWWVNSILLTSGDIHLTSTEADNLPLTDACYLQGIEWLVGKELFIKQDAFIVITTIACITICVYFHNLTTIMGM